MTKIGYKQSAEHKRKRLSQIEGDSNGRWAGGHHPDYYRKKAGAKTNDGTIVHHKNGDRENNKKSNLERLTDGDCVPGRRTTPKHEQITDRTSRKDGTKGKRCPGGYWIPQSKKCALKQTGHFTHRTAEGGRKSAIENIVWPATALAIAGAGVAGLSIALASGGKPSGNAEKKQLIKTIVSSEEKKNPEVTIAPPAEKPFTPTPPPVPKGDRPPSVPAAYRTTPVPDRKAEENQSARTIVTPPPAERKQLIGAIIKSKGKKKPVTTIAPTEAEQKPDVTIAPPAEKPVAPTPPPVPKGDRPKKGLIRVPKSSGNAEKKKLIETIVKAAKKKVTIAPAAKKKTAPKPPPALVKAEAMKRAKLLLLPAPGETTDMPVSPATTRSSTRSKLYVPFGGARISTAPDVEKTLISPSGRQAKRPKGAEIAGDKPYWGSYREEQEKKGKRVYRKRLPKESEIRTRFKKKTDSTIAIRLAMKQAV